MRFCGADALVVPGEGRHGVSVVSTFKILSAAACVIVERRRDLPTLAMETSGASAGTRGICKKS